MSRGHTRHTTLVVAVTVAVVVAGWTPVAAGARPTADGTGGQTSLATDRPAATTPPTTADGYLAAFRNLSNDPALSAYGELEVLRSRAVAAVQVGSFDDDRSRRMRGVLAVLRNFSAAYDAAAAGERRRSLARANETARAVDRLRAAGGRNYAALAQLALDRFYRDRGDRLRDRARSADRTPTQLTLFRLAVRAYQRGGATDRLSATSTNLERLSAEYRTDVSLLNRSEAAAATFRASCDDRCRDPQTAIRAFGLGVFDRYVGARAAVSGARQAAALSSEHGLDDRLERARGLESWGVGALRALTLASLALIGGYTLVFALLGALVMARLSAWGRDARDATLGDILPREPLEVDR